MDLYHLSKYLLYVLIVFCTVGCNNKSTETKHSVNFYKGEEVYRSTCISCHNADPRKPGPIGPEIAGADSLVLRSMILTGKPPKGVKPKWPDSEMAPLPHLESQVPYLYEFLQAYK